MWIVYVLLSEKDHHRYIGVTHNLIRRIRGHERGGVTSTKHRRPLNLIHTEQFEVKKKAFLREKFLKTGRGRAELNQLLNMPGQV